jgi:transcriptional regulator with XRE-family HTH domain
MRLERGWSQQQLAAISGVNVRTIQRIEGGQPASVETVKALAAAFEMEFNELREAIMRGSIENQEDTPVNQALQHARNLRRFYGTIIVCALVSAVFVIVDLVFDVGDFPTPMVVAALVILVIGRWFQLFGVDQWFGPEWEKRMVERRLGRKLHEPDGAPRGEKRPAAEAEQARKQ